MISCLTGYFKCVSGGKVCLQCLIHKIELQFKERIKTK